MTGKGKFSHNRDFIKMELLFLPQFEFIMWDSASRFALQ